MTLTLKIISHNDIPHAAEKCVVIHDQYATIGRSDNNTLTLPDEEKIISRRHAAITFENQHYILTDTSLAGIFINNANEPVNNASVQLVDGMQIKIGKYVVAVGINDQAPVAASIPPVNPFADDNLVRSQDQGNALLDSVFDTAAPGLLTGSYNREDSGYLLTGSADDLLNQAVTQSPSADNSLLNSDVTMEPPVNKGLSSENFSSLSDSYIPPEPVQNNPQPSHGEIPEDFHFEDFFKEDSDVTPPQAPAGIVANDDSLLDFIEPEARAAASHSSHLAAATPVSTVVGGTESQHLAYEDGQLLQAFLRGAQIEDKGLVLSNPAEKMARIGVMFRQFVESTVNVMRNRAEFKSLFRVSVTTIKVADNNPLKFSVTTDEALKHLISNGQAGFKGSVESIDEGFNDLLNHQLAMQAGIQASLTEILRQFDPDTIEKQFSEGLVLQKKSKCWEKYLQVHAGLAATAVDDFFGDAFSEAYEQQMRMLKSDS